MQKVFKSCYKMDEKCYNKYGLSEDILMEHAATAIEDYIRDNFNKQSSILIVAGAGNNGADGITLSRLLHRDFNVVLYLPFDVKSNMAKLQLNRAKMIGVEVVNKLQESEIIIDALFGAGLNRELNSKSIEIIEALNKYSGFKIACDIPSGLDVRGVPNPISFRADITITMGALKEALFLDSAKDCVGKIKVANLGIARELYEDESSCFLLEFEDFKPPLRKLQDTHKGSFGHACIFVGEKEGAGVISAMAASRFGAGLTTIIYHEKVQVPPYIMSSSSIPKGASAIAIGMGLGEFFEDEMLQKEVIKSNLPIIIDADALYKKELLEIIKQEREVVITPHPKEFSAILKILENKDFAIKEIQQNRFELAREFSKKYPNCALLLKGANPIVAKNGKLFINPHGNNALAKGGSGDILSGLIVALLAQGYNAKESAIHSSLALAQASKQFSKSSYSLLPIDIIELLGVN